MLRFLSGGHPGIVASKHATPLLGAGRGGAGTRRRGKGALGLPGGAGTAQGEAQQQGWPNPLPAAAAFW